jgi:hypothetical protein
VAARILVTLGLAKARVPNERVNNLSGDGEPPQSIRSLIAKPKRRYVQSSSLARNPPPNMVRYRLHERPKVVWRTFRHICGAQLDCSQLAHGLAGLG